MPNELFCSRFTDVWGKEVKNVAHVARTQLFAGEIVQKTCTMSKYTKQFRATAYKVGDMQEADRISFYIQGLKPEIRVMCAVDCFGKPWESLEKCIDFAHGCEMRLITVAKAFPSDKKPAASQGPAPELDGYTLARSYKKAMAGWHKDNQIIDKNKNKAETSADGAGSCSKRAKFNPETLPDEEINRVFPNLTNKQYKDYRSKGMCFNCGAVKKHSARDCPEPKAKPLDSKDRGKAHQ